MWNNNDDRYVHPDEERKDLNSLKAFNDKANELKAKVGKLKAVLAKEFMTFSDERLRKYQYHHDINMAVLKFVELSGLDEDNYGFDFWLPSNIGC